MGFLRMMGFMALFWTAHRLYQKVRKVKPARGPGEPSRPFGVYRGDWWIYCLYASVADSQPSVYASVADICRPSVRTLRDWEGPGAGGVGSGGVHRGSVLPISSAVLKRRHPHRRSLGRRAGQARCHRPEPQNPGPGRCHARRNQLPIGRGQGRGALPGHTIYSTLMPCNMCAGAVVQSRITKFIVGASENFPERNGLKLLQRHGVEVVDLDLQEAKDLLREFTQRYSEQWSRDIGR